MAKIVVVEDDCYLRSDILTCLSKAGHRVHGIAAFASPEAEILAEQPDLVILDLNLPGRSGFQICQYLKLHTACPVLILTGRDQLQDELRAGAGRR